ncbi:MAG: ABC transporter permease [Bacteroidales bacterium]|nr:ABC transporter permease [Bacteroidales bacterium]MCF8386491.1 ABC transporter permease [Bacteroidales bacterium]MCF8397105.1 ABC transporter permease [Bacteroidales bacterium]
MRTILFILQKEFIQIFRNKTMLPIIFIMPLVQMLVLVYTATLEMKNIEVVVVDRDLSQTSRELTAKFDGSEFFIIRGSTFDLKEAEDMLRENKADLIINIPDDFERQLFREGNVKVQLQINAINATAAGLTNAYATSIIADFNRHIITESINMVKPVQMKKINVASSFWYNPELNYKIYMLPGILVILVTIIGMFLTALNLVREKEMGTIEQINVTPIKKYQFIAGKLIPFWIIALFELAFGLTIGKVIFDIPMEGNLLVLFAFAAIYLLAMLGLGLFISTFSSTQQQVMFIAFFFFLTFVMMSGIFTPVESMPEWAQKVNVVNPFAYFIKVNRMNLLKGSGFWDFRQEFLALGIYAIAALSLAVWKYRKVV